MTRSGAASFERVRPCGWIQISWRTSSCCGSAADMRWRSWRFSCCDCSWYGRFAAAPISRHCWPSTFLTSYELSSGFAAFTSSWRSAANTLYGFCCGRACSPLVRREQ